MDRQPSVESKWVTAPHDGVATALLFTVRRGGAHTIPVQYLVNVPEGFSRLVLEHRCRPGPGLRAALLTDLSQAAQGGLAGLLLRLRQDGHSLLRLLGPAGLQDAVDGLSHFVRFTHPTIEVSCLTAADQGVAYEDECLEVRPLCGAAEQAGGAIRAQNGGRGGRGGDDGSSNSGSSSSGDEPTPALGSSSSSSSGSGSDSSTSSSSSSSDGDDDDDNGEDRADDPAAKRHRGQAVHASASGDGGASGDLFSALDRLFTSGNGACGLPALGRPGGRQAGRGGGRGRGHGRGGRGAGGGGTVPSFSARPAAGVDAALRSAVLEKLRQGAASEEPKQEPTGGRGLKAEKGAASQGPRGEAAGGVEAAPGGQAASTPFDGTDSDPVASIQAELLSERGGAGLGQMLQPQQQQQQQPQTAAAGGYDGDAAIVELAAAAAAYGPAEHTGRLMRPEYSAGGGGGPLAAPWPTCGHWDGPLHAGAAYGRTGSAYGTQGWQPDVALPYSGHDEYGGDVDDTAAGSVADGGESDPRLGLSAADWSPYGAAARGAVDTDAKHANGAGAGCTVSPSERTVDNRDAARRVRCKLLGVAAQVHGAGADLPFRLPRDASVLFLGTGCAEPSKYRGGSGVLLRGLGPTRGSLLIDAGEGAMGALVRWLGHKGAIAEVSSLSLVWLSHKHPDHVLGLPGLLESRPPSSPPLLVVGPQEVASWLSRLAPLHPSWRFVFLHCGDFAGDTRPCPALIAAGAGATLLVHEATFEPCLEVQARKKRHCTSAEAAQVAEAMGAYRTVLTHFSQRYPHLPAGLDPWVSPPHRRPLPAFDGLLLPLAALPALPLLLPPLAEALGTAAAEEEETVAEAQQPDAPA
ncbi:hypothetical protein GPECTOR_30g190 [Gonium pectorale]|uniref:ribonuclease Z n=1 Tax=Gonium pectorale TaxID=33097 RepID=A0A150GEU8_GONPE|nr:hypothetical protein GPECTOR_30g190 [Gonium pectorale]|eukprot:KXZ48095.1 hypothetical protein GPECTOR_30g190 [Gonium pectorale]